MQEVEVIARSIDLLKTLLTAEQARMLDDADHRARAAFGDRTIWHVNATSRGGGVAEMLQTLLAFGLAAQIDNRWLVLDGDPEFFTITKRLHNVLHGDPGDGGPLGDAERAHYEQVLAANVAELGARISDARHRCAPRPAARRHGRWCAGHRRPSRVALPHRERQHQRADRTGVGVPPALHRAGRRLRLHAA